MGMEHAISLAIDQIYYAIANSSILRENKTMLLSFFLNAGTRNITTDIVALFSIFCIIQMHKLIKSILEVLSKTK